ncbi:uncharacterized protein IUM83_12666 [Phytophthora cinnamomi]|uniref:uncharacterized protein n=1 Tax=Phytophthora cinnamomi TaxID=4785 RepID=UPI003559D26C|nr:hypothetical protein IUM83_12666 [Phytophthora cinnamomi]
MRLDCCLNIESIFYSEHRGQQYDRREAQGCSGGAFVPCVNVRCNKNRFNTRGHPEDDDADSGNYIDTGIDKSKRSTSGSKITRDALANIDIHAEAFGVGTNNFNRGDAGTNSVGTSDSLANNHIHDAGLNSDLNSQANNDCTPRSDTSFDDLKAIPNADLNSQADASFNFSGEQWQQRLGRRRAKLSAPARSTTLLGILI